MRSMKPYMLLCHQIPLHNQLIEVDWRIYASLKQIIIGSDNGLSPGRRQAIIGTNGGLLWIGALGTNFSKILI